MKSSTVEIRRESTYIITNAILTSEDPKHLQFIVMFNHGVLLSLFTSNLKLNDAALIMEILQALGELLKLDKLIQREQGEESVAY